MDIYKAPPKRGRPRKVPKFEPINSVLDKVDSHPDHAWQRAQIGGGFLKCPVCNEIIPNVSL